jgi:hypothetical protein
MKYQYESDEIPIPPEILDNVIRVSSLQPTARPIHKYVCTPYIHNPLHARAKAKASSAFVYKVDCVVDISFPSFPRIGSGLGFISAV